MMPRTTPSRKNHPPLKNPAENFLLDRLIQQVDTFSGRGRKRSLQEVIRLMRLPTKRLRKEDNEPIVPIDLFRINKGISLELLMAGCFSAIDSVQARANCIADAEGNPFDYAPGGTPDIQMKVEDVHAILEVSSMRTPIISESYQKNLDSALKHLSALSPPAYCFHITNLETEDAKISEEQEERIEQLEREGRHLVPVSIKQTVSFLSEFTANIKKPRMKEKPLMDAKAMAEWLETLRYAASKKRDLAEATREFLKPPSKPKPNSKSSTDPMPGF